MRSTAPHRIFLSYARVDGQPAANELRTHLANPALTADAPLAVWQDLTSMRSGQWREQIRAAIKTGDHLLMVLSPGALASEVCAWEWQIARLEGAEISPVLADSTLTIDALPKWMTAQHIYRLDLAAPGLAEHREWQRLVASLRAATTSRRMPTISRTPGERFVPRPTEMDALRDMLLDARGDAVGFTTAFTGSGGMGKTTLALALAQDQRIQSAFYGGQLLIELGQQPNLLLVLRTAIQDLTGKVPDAETVKQATEQLAAELADRRVLLVIDDVWQSFHLEPFMQGGPNCARLVTTRDEGALAKYRGATKPVTVDQMSEEQAVALLGAGLPTEDAAAQSEFLKALANRLGRCALLLELANGRIWTWARDRGGLPAAVYEAEVEFRFKGVTAFDTEDRAPVDLSNPATRNEAYADSIAASLDMLRPEHKTRFLELAILPENTDVPYASIALYWGETAGMDERATINLLDRLKRMSLVKGALAKDVNPATNEEAPCPAIRLHDVIRGYARDPVQTKPDALTDLNRQFWEAHVNAGASAFAEGTALARYAYMRLPWHLNEAKESAALDALLLQPAWLQGKLSAAGSPHALVSDYQQFGQGEMQNIIGRTLRLTMGILARDPRQLLPQLFGRLMASSHSNVRAFLQDARDLMRLPIILPTSLSLSPPGAESTRLEGHTNWVMALAVLPDGRLASGSYDNTIRLWDTESHNETIVLRGHSWVLALAVLPDGRLASGSADGTIGLWDPQDGTETAELKGHTHWVTGLAALPNGRLATCSSDSTIRIWDLRKEIESARLECRSIVLTLVALPDGRLAANSSGSILLWNPEQSTEDVEHVGGVDGGVNSIAVFPDGRLASISNHAIRLWDVRTKEGIRLHNLSTVSLPPLCALSAGRVATGANDNSIRILDLSTGAEVDRFEGHTDEINDLALLPDGRLASRSHDGTVRLWDLQSRAAGAQPENVGGSVTALAVDPSGRLISGSDDSQIRIWDTKNRIEIGRLNGNLGIAALALLPNGGLISSSGENGFRLWDLSRFVQTGQFAGPMEITRLARALCMLPNGQLASAGPIGSTESIGTSGRIYLWDLEIRRPLAFFDGHTGQVGALCVLPDRRLASGAADGRILLWDLFSFELTPLAVDAGRVSALVMLPDGRLASGSTDGIIRLWNLSGGTETVQLVGHSSGDLALALLPNGRLASASGDSTIRVWDHNANRELCRLEVDGGVLSLAALPDGRLVAGDALGRLHWLELLL